MVQQADRYPWEKQKGESRQAFEAFALYRDMGPSRSLRKVARQLSKSETLMKRWSSKWSWHKRAIAWDAELDEQVREAQEKARKEMSERHIKEAMLMQQKLVESLKNIDPSELTPNDIARWLDTAVKIERMARGEPTENVSQEVRGQVSRREEYHIEQKLQADPEAAKLLKELFRRSKSMAGTSED